MEQDSRPQGERKERERESIYVSHVAYSREACWMLICERDGMLIGVVMSDTWEIVWCRGTASVRLYTSRVPSAAPERGSEATTANTPCPDVRAWWARVRGSKPNQTCVVRLHSATSYGWGRAVNRTPSPLLYAPDTTRQSSPPLYRSTELLSRHIASSSSR